MRWKAVTRTSSTIGSSSKRRWFGRSLRKTGHPRHRWQAPVAEPPARESLVFQQAAKLQLRTGFFNAFNHATFDNPNVGTASAANFGTITGVVNLERHIQMALRLTW